MQNVDFVDGMSELYKDMCEHYSYIEKAFENFKTVYAMVKQDYKGNYEEEEIPLNATYYRTINTKNKCNAR